MEEEKEIWRNISGYPGYQVSSLGRVKSMERKVKHRNGSIRTITGKILKPYKNRNGYLQVNLYKGKKMKSMYIHRLVASAFVQNDSLFNTEINHIDECKTNNCASNLEWSTREHNCNFGTRNKRISKTKTGVYNTKKSKPVKCLETGLIFPSTMEVQRQFGFDNCYIGYCCKGKYKQAYGYHWRYVD